MSITNNDTLKHRLKTPAKWHSKPLMEKRRRARINQSLAELKNLISGFCKSKYSKSNKLEKADILEMTVNYLQWLMQQKVVSVAHPFVLMKFREGFLTCARETAAFIQKLDGLDEGIRSHVLQHLNSCVDKNLIQKGFSRTGVDTDGGSPDMITASLPLSTDSCSCVLDSSNSSIYTKTSCLQNGSAMNNVVFMFCRNLSENEGFTKNLLTYTLIDAKETLKASQQSIAVQHVGLNVTSNPAIILPDSLDTKLLWRPW